MTNDHGSFLNLAMRAGTRAQDFISARHPGGQGSFQTTNGDSQDPEAETIADQDG